MYRVLTGKGGWPPARARQAAGSWIQIYSPIETSASVMAAALELADLHRFSIWDAVIMAAAAEARFDMLLSEDMHHGFAWRGVTVINPFALAPRPLLAQLLRRSGEG